jgi:serine/threonine protein kinase
MLVVSRTLYVLLIDLHAKLTPIINNDREIINNGFDQAKRDDDPRSDASFADIYHRPRDDSTMQGIDRTEQEEVRSSYQHAALDMAVGAGGKGEIYHFLEKNCVLMIPEDRLREIANSAKQVRIMTMDAFAKTLESSSDSEKRKALHLSDFELASIMKALEDRNMLQHAESNDFLANGLKVHNLQPLQVMSCVDPSKNKRYAKGMFTGQVVITNLEGDMSARQVCLKSNIGTIRDVDAEVKIFKDLRDVSGVVEMISHGKVYHGSYFVTEWFGCNLCEFLASSSFVSAEERIQIFTELCGAVCSLHSRNIMHGDISPDNILVDIGEFGLSIMLCDLSNARKVGELYPHNPDGTLPFTPGYCPPEVYFGSAKQCRASTKIDVFNLGLVGGMLLSRHAAASSYVGVLPNDDVNALKTALRQQETMNGLLLSNLEDLSCKDVLLAMCNLTPAHRGDAETVVNILQTRNSTVERNFDASFKDLYGLFENFATTLHGAIVALHSDFIFREDLQKSLVSLGEELQRSKVWVGRKVGDPKECLRLIQGLSIKIVNVYAKKQPEAAAAELSVSFIECVTNITGTVEFVDGHDANNVAADKLSAIHALVTKEVADCLAAHDHMTHLGDAVKQVISADDIFSRKINIMKSFAAHMTSNQMEQVADLNNSIARMEQSLRAVEGINMGLVHFMRNELNNQYDKLNDCLRRTHHIPHLFLLLPKIASIGEGDEEIHQIVIYPDEFTLHFLCSQTLQIVPSGEHGAGFSVHLPREQMDKIAPLALICLLIVRKALETASEVLSTVGLPRMMRSSLRHVQFVDFAIQLLLNPPVTEEECPPPQEIDLASFDSIDLDDSSLEVIRDSPLSAEVAFIGYDTLWKVMEGKKLKVLDASMGMRRVVCQGKVGWVLDTDAVEAGFMGFGN